MPLAHVIRRYARPLPISILHIDASQRSDNVPMNKCAFAIAKRDRSGDPAEDPWRETLQAI